MQAMCGAAGHASAAGCSVGEGVAVTCSCATDPATCKPCAEQRRIDRQGRALVDLLDSGTMDPAVRAEILGARSSAGGR